MPKDSLGDKLERQVEQVKGGVKKVAHKLTEEDESPRTDAMAGRKSGAMSRPAARGRTSSKSKAVSDLRTKEQLYAEAARIGVKGRSRMTKDQLAKAVRRG